MRIGLFIDTQNYGGAESVLLSLAAFLERVGHEPVIYQYDNADLQRASSELGIECRQVTHWYAYKRTYRLPVFAYHFRRLLAADRIDVLHSHLFGPIIAGGLTGWLASIPHVGTLHDVYIVQERPIRARLLRLVHTLGTRLVCVSQQMAEYYASVTNIASTELRVIRNGVQLSLYGRSPRDNVEGGSDVALIAVGRLDPIKRHDLLLDALANVHEKIRWRLTLVGDGPERGALESQARQLGIDSRVEFLGQRDDVPELLSRADIFFLISDSEGMSLSLIEALASGLPVIATKVGNNSELVEHEHSGYLITPGSQPELEAAIASLCADADHREELGRNARAVAAELDLEKTMSAYLDLYAALTSAD